MKRGEGLAGEGRIYSVNDALAVFASGGDVGTDGTEGVSAVLRAEGAGDFLFEFDHAHIALCLVVVERDSEIVHESEYLWLVSLEAVQEILGLGLLGFALGGRGWRRGRINGKALGKDVFVARLEGSEGVGIQAGSWSVGVLDSVLDSLLDVEQQGLHVVSPLLSIFFMGQPEFAQVMTVAEGMVTLLVDEIGSPVVMHGCAVEMGQDVYTIHGFSTAFGVGLVVGQSGRAGHM